MPEEFDVGVAGGVAGVDGVLDVAPDGGESLPFSSGAMMQMMKVWGSRRGWSQAT